MAKPWTDGPRELIQHAIDHLNLGSDADRRFAFISIDNSVELMMKTFLGLPERARGTKGPTRKILEEANESFPELLSLLEEFASAQIVGLGLDDIEWYHRLRNQLYHSGNGITVGRSQVEAYLQIALTLFNNLFHEAVEVSSTAAIETKTGQFLRAWNDFQETLRSQLPPRDGQPAMFWKMDYLKQLEPKLPEVYESLSRFRNELVHGLATPEPETFDQQLKNLTDLLKKLNKQGT